MQVYAQLYTKNLADEVSETMGTFGVCVIDARLSLDSMIEVGRQLAIREYGAGRSIIGFAIVRSERFIDTLDRNEASKILSYEGDFYPYGSTIGAL